MVSLVRRFLLSRAIIVVETLILAVLLRLLLGNALTLLEVLLCVGLLASWSQVEIVVHWVMHAIPGTALFNRHADHHINPKDTVLGTLPTYIACFLLPIGPYACSMPVLLSIVATGIFALLVYEFVHFSIHSDYEPRTELGKRQKANHLAHHLRPGRNLAVVFPPKSEQR